MKLFEKYYEIEEVKLKNNEHFFTPYYVQSFFGFHIREPFTCECLKNKRESIFYFYSGEYIIHQHLWKFKLLKDCIELVKAVEQHDSNLKLLKKDYSKIVYKLKNGKEYNF